MEIVIGIIVPLIFLGIASCLFLIPVFFILKRKNIFKLWAYLLSSFLVGGLVAFGFRVLFLSPSGLKELTSEGNVLVTEGSITLEGYLAAASTSHWGGLFVSIIGLLWWSTMVRPLNTYKNV